MATDDRSTSAIRTTATWDDLVLPDAPLATLRQIASCVRNGPVVQRDWGFAERNPDGLGVTALFSGPSGTGKTMAAGVLANDLQLDLLRIDLSRVVSKYIGETEKNLSRVFDDAAASGAILFFDEADALFGRRSQVKDATDRYAGIDVKYLLQRLERFSGLAILASNLKGNLDEAFTRRMRFIVAFADPDRRQREAIWRGVFPAATPVATLDYARLAQLDVNGGAIRAIAVDAAYTAAAGDGAVSMAHLRDAAEREAGQRGRKLSAAEIRGWV